jgi:3-(3-hydroxy-phenyl)propionate hydroxylase
MAAPGRSRRTHFDVIIVGMGPVGAVCANLMGKYGVQTLVFEKEVEVYNGPRAVAIDAETTRIFGMIDLDEWLDRHVLKAGYQVLSASEGQRWPVVDLQTTGQAYGYSKISYFYQPTVEAELRRNLKKFPKVNVFLGYEVTDVAEGPDDLVYVQVKYIGGLSGEVYTCKYLLACDGGRSTVRRQMKLRYEGKADTERWLVLDLHSKNKDINHCWSKFTYVIAGKRPYLHVPLPESYHRFELLLDDHEDAEEMTKLDNVKRMLNSVGLDSSQVSLHRRIVYKFHSRMVEQWNIGHAFLLGDAAHSLPPFRGQGSTGTPSIIIMVVCILGRCISQFIVLKGCTHAFKKIK